jgi:hypothetical protein
MQPTIHPTLHPTIYLNIHQAIHSTINPTIYLIIHPIIKMTIYPIIQTTILPTIYPTTEQPFILLLIRLFLRSSVPPSPQTRRLNQPDSHKKHAGSKLPRTDINV